MNKKVIAIIVAIVVVAAGLFMFMGFFASAIAATNHFVLIYV